MRTTALPLLRSGLRQRRRGLLLWGLGLAVVVLMYLPLYPSIGGSLDEQIAAMPDDLTQAFGLGETDAAGYTQSTVYGLLGAVLLIIYAVTASARALAAEEETGLLDLYLAHGISRQRLLAERALQLIVELTALVAVVVLLTLALSPGSGLGFAAPQVVAAGLGLLGLGVLTAATGLAVGAATGSRAGALGAAALVGVGGYLANVLSDIADLPWLKDVSPFHWAYGFEPLRNGFDGAATLLLPYGLAAACYLIGALLFARRDVGV